MIDISMYVHILSNCTYSNVVCSDCYDVCIAVQNVVMS